MHRITKLFIALVFPAAAVVRGETQTFGVIGDEETDSVYIESTATLEFFDGVGKALLGQFDFDPDAPSAGATGLIRFDLRSLRTGIDLRDRHMRERHLNTEDYPYCYYELVNVTGLPDQLNPDSTYLLTGEGRFYIRGVGRPMQCALEIKRISPDGALPLLSARAMFSVTLDEFEIPRPKAVFLKLAERIEVTVDFRAHPDRPVDSLALPTGWKMLDQREP